MAPIEEITPPQPDPQPDPEPEKDGRSKAEYAAVVTAALDILSFRLAVIIAVAAEAGMFGYSVWNPDVVRIAAAAAFAVLVGIPLMYFYRNPG
ncbi:MAG TPA: hypothetical protein VFF88_11260 [Methylocella sp.]|nr:hypothetical protein [Methylocella sp.]